MTAGLPGNGFITIEKSRLTPLELWAFTTDEPLVKSVEVDDAQQLIINLRDGRCYTFPLTLFPELAFATNDQIHDVTTLDLGAVLQWTELDVHYAVKSLIEQWETQGGKAASSAGTATADYRGQEHGC